MNRERLLFGMLLLGTALLAFWSLGSLPLVDVDEPVYGQVGREMAHVGLSGWLTPHYGGQPWFDKPPLFYWLTALSMRLLGVSEFAARLPSALLSVGLVAATYALARRAFPDTPRAGLWAGFALATSVQFFLLARAAVTDMTLALTLTLALLGLTTWTQTGRARWVLLAGLMTGLAALTKGPVALVLIGIQAVAYLLLTRQARRLASPALWAGMLLCLAVALPWFALMIREHGRLFVDGFLEANNVTRYLQAEHSASSSPLYFFAVLPLGFFPWSLALPGALTLAWRQARAGWDTRETDNSALFLGLWVVLVFVFFSASQSKLPTYIFPLYPAAAVLVGRWLADRHETSPRFDPLWLYAVLSLLLGGALFVLGRKYGVDAGTRWGWLAVGVGAAVLAVARRDDRRAWLVPGLAMAFTLLLVWCSPTWKTREDEVSERRLAVRASAATPPDGVIHALGLKHPSIRYYATRPVVFTDDHGLAAQDIRRHPGVVYAMRPKDADDLRRRGVTNFHILARYAHTLLVQATPEVKARTESNEPHQDHPGAGDAAGPVVRFSDVQRDRQH